jgi:hypothetical protein
MTVGNLDADVLTVGYLDVDVLTVGNLDAGEHGDQIGRISALWAIVTFA